MPQYLNWYGQEIANYNTNKYKTHCSTWSLWR